MSEFAITVRRAEITDLAGLTDLGVGIQRLHHEGRPDLFRAPDAPSLAQFFAEMLDDPERILLIAMADVAVGYLLAEIDRRPESTFMLATDLAYIHHIAVDAGARGRGVGTALMAAAETEATELGLSAIQLDSWEFNTEAHDFFRARGFRDVNRVFERRLGER